MIKITIDEFNNYKQIANKVLHLLASEKHSSLRDIDIIYHIILGFVYCLDRDGQYTYERRFYNSFDELPYEAQKEVLRKAYLCVCSGKFHTEELPKIRKQNQSNNKDSLS